MKKQFFTFAVAAVMIGSIAAGCSSEKKAGGADSTGMAVTDSATLKKDSTSMPTDTAKKDTVKAPPQR